MPTGRQRAYRVRGSRVSLWSPLALAPTALWDGADVASLGDTASVTTWTSRVGGHTLAQSSAPSKPTVVLADSALANQTSVLSDGVDDFLFCSSAAALFASQAAISLYAVVRGALPGSTKTPLYAGQGGVTTLEWDATPSGDSLAAYNDSTGVASTVTDAGGARLVRIVYSAGGLTQIRALGTNGSSATGPSTGLRSTTNTFGIGAYVISNVSAILPWSGAFAYLVLWQRSLSAAEDTQVRSYLAARYGVTA